MKKISERIVKRLWLPYLYLDDLHNIQAYLKEGLRPDSLTIDTDKYEKILSIDELTQSQTKEEKYICFAIRFDNDKWTFIKLDLRGTRAVFSFDNEHPLVFGVCENIYRDIIQPRTYPTWFFLIRIMLSLFLSVIINAAFLKFTLRFMVLPNENIEDFIVLFAILVVVITLILTVALSIPKGKIFLVPASEKKSGLIANLRNMYWDRIIGTTVSLIVGGLIGTLWHYFRTWV